jgi:predicted RNA methylase
MTNQGFSMTNSYAHRAQRHSGRKDPTADDDFYPTPPWATRALMTYGLTEQDYQGATCLEPACGNGVMAKVLKEYFHRVDANDIVDRGYLGTVENFLTMDTQFKYNWVITNPPFSIADQFILKAFEVSTVGVAMFARTQLLEGKARYEQLYSPRPPTLVMPFVERVPLYKNRLNPTGSTATSYSWFVWKHDYGDDTLVRWIPPCRKLLERESDYE